MEAMMCAGTRGSLADGTVFVGDAFGNLLLSVLNKAD